MDLVLPLIQESLVPPAKDFFEEDGLALSVNSPFSERRTNNQMADKSLQHRVGVYSYTGQELDSTLVWAFGASRIQHGLARRLAQPA